MLNFEGINFSNYAKLKHIFFKNGTNVIESDEHSFVGLKMNDSFENWIFRKQMVGRYFQQRRQTAWRICITGEQ